MPSLPELLARRAGIPIERIELQEDISEPDSTLLLPTLVKRINIPYNSSTAPAGLIDAETRDPWSQSGKYALGWVYFCIILLVFAIGIRIYHIWTDQIRKALQQEQHRTSVEASPATHYEMANMYTDKSTNKFFPRFDPPPTKAASKEQSSISSIPLVNNTIAFSRFLFYRPLPIVRIHKKLRPIEFPSLGVALIVCAALIFVTLYSFVPQPLYWQSIRFGSPPLAIRSGMIAVAMMPWLVALSMKANLVSLLTGIGHERLNVLHRWGGWLCLFLSLIHVIPFYVQSVWDNGGYNVFRTYFGTGIYVYGTGT